MLPSAGGLSIGRHCPLSRRPLSPRRPSPPLTTGTPFVHVRGVTSMPATVQGTVAKSHLGVDGRIYDNGKPIEHPAYATIDAIEQYLAEIVVKNHLDPELFKDDDTQS